MLITDPTWIFFTMLSIILFAPMLLERLHIPSIVGMIFAGILIGPHGFHVLDRDSSFELFGKVGIYYIMFLASLEMNLNDVQRIRWRALVFGLLSFAIPMAIGYWANTQLLSYSIAASVRLFTAGSRSQIASISCDASRHRDFTDSGTSCSAVLAARQSFFLSSSIFILIIFRVSSHTGAGLFTAPTAL